MKRFHHLQSVVCRKEETWVFLDGSGPAPYGPIFNEVVTVDYYCRDGSNFMTLMEYQTPVSTGQRAAFNAAYFAPLSEISELTSVLKAQPETV